MSSFNRFSILSSQPKKSGIREMKSFLPYFLFAKYTEDSHMSYVRLRSCAHYIHINCFLLLLTTITPVFHLRFFTGKLRAENSFLRSSIYSLSTWLMLMFSTQIFIATRLSSNDTALHFLVFLFLSERIFRISQHFLSVTENVFLHALSYVHEVSADCKIITKSTSPRSLYRIQDELFTQLTSSRRRRKPQIFLIESSWCLKHF